jgi:hypothetical protein
MTAVTNTNDLLRICPTGIIQMMALRRRLFFTNPAKSVSDQDGRGERIAGFHAKLSSTFVVRGREG